MNRREINEIKKNFRTECGFFTLNKILVTIVNADHEVEMQKASSSLLLSEREERMYRDILLQTLNSNIGKKSIQIDFETSVDKTFSPSHEVLYNIVNTSLNSEQAVTDYIDKIVLTYPSLTPYAVITAHCTYTVRHKNRNDEPDEMNEEDFKFIVSAYCPVCSVDSGFSYDFATKTFSTDEDKKLYIIPKARCGLFYPAFDNRTANICSAMIYTSKSKEPPVQYIEEVLGCRAPLTAEAEKSRWRFMLAATFRDKLNYLSLYELNERLLNVTEAWTKETRMTAWGENDFVNVFEEFGASEEEINNFRAVWRYNKDIGMIPGYLYLENIVDKKFTIKTSEFTVSYSASHGDVVSPTIVDSSRALNLKTADAIIDVNGAEINL